MRNAFLVFLLAVAQLACNGGGVMELAPDEPVDTLIEEQRTRLRIPGLSYAVIDEGQLVEVGGLGLQNLDGNAPVTRNTVFEIGSLTKPITAASVMMLVEEGRLSVSDRITDHLAGLPDAWSKVTVRHLLSHTSGIKSYTDLVDFLTLSQTEYTHSDILNMIIDHPLEFEPGTDWDYNNSGYYLLGMLIEEVSGQSYWEFLRTRMFEPLGMSATGPTDQNSSGFARADGYSWTGQADGWVPRHGITASAGFAAGSIASTAADLAKWLAALSGGDIVVSSSLEEMWSPVVRDVGGSSGYGYGWYINTYEGQTVVEHSGASPGFTAYALHFTEDDITVLVLANRWLLDSGTMPREIALLLRAVGGHYARANSTSALEAVP